MKWVSLFLLLQNLVMMTKGLFSSDYNKQRLVTGAFDSLDRVIEQQDQTRLGFFQRHPSPAGAGTPPSTTFAADLRASRPRCSSSVISIAKHPMFSGQGLIRKSCFSNNRFSEKQNQTRPKSHF
jgi:hypothetical protein